MTFNDIHKLLILFIISFLNPESIIWLMKSWEIGPLSGMRRAAWFHLHIPVYKHRKVTANHRLKKR